VYCVGCQSLWHWYLDVTFGEDVDRTLDVFVAFNLNILRKLALIFLRLVDVGRKGEFAQETLHN